MNQNTFIPYNKGMNGNELRQNGFVNNMNMMNNQNGQYMMGGNGPKMMDDHFENTYGTVITSDDLMVKSTVCNIPPSVIDDILNEAYKDVYSMQSMLETVNRPVLTKKDYYTQPPMYMIERMSAAELQHMEYFEIFRLGKTIDEKGVSIEWKVSIAWHKDVDISNVNLDHVVFLERESVEVYPDFMTKPRQGEKLNKKAVIAFENCFRDEKEFNMAVEIALQNEREKRIQHVIPDRKTRSLAYEVPHFTKYSFKGEVVENKPISKDINTSSTSSQSQQQPQQQTSKINDINKTSKESMMTKEESDDYDCKEKTKEIKRSMIVIDKTDDQRTKMTPVEYLNFNQTIREKIESAHQHQQTQWRNPTILLKAPVYSPFTILDE